MPIKETLKRRPSERSTCLNLNLNCPHENHLGWEGTPASSKDSVGFAATRKMATIPNKIVISYENMFVGRDVNLSSFRNGNGSQYTPRFMADKGDSLSMFSEESFGTPGQTSRMAGGTNRTQQAVDKLILSPSQCKIKPPGMAYFDNKTKVNVISLKMRAEHKTVKSTNFQYQPTTQTTGLPKTRTRGTQSLYRESSAQTLPYLPAVSNDPDELECMELFKLPTILPGDGPPGLYEVEVLERARKRWAFAKALKDNFRKQLAEARQQAKLPQHEDILQAFEWEHWIEREEYIQECQMLRLEILIRMFDKREREMRNASHLRIQQSCVQIEAKRKAALRKNEIEFGRAMRRLEIQHSKQPRTWRKEHISQGLGDPSSEFYAPKMRYGNDPSRRHFTASRKGFDMRMDDLERKTVKMDPGHLKCPFAKLRAWSKPKEVVQEVEQNFCSEVNLRKLYESLRTLRETTDKAKTTPLCLKSREIPSTIPEEPGSARSTKVTIMDEVANYEYQSEDYTTEDSEIQRLRDEHEHQEYLREVSKEKQTERQLREHLQREMSHEEFETLIQAYEGNTIGWLMRFLSEEMCRLKEQRKLHFFTMLAKRERWHREAAEAGLRQKENCMRDTYEKLYQECEQANVEMAEKYMHTILEDDIKEFAHQEAEDHVVAQAKDLDMEIARWLETLKDVQTPLNYNNLRYALRDIVIPDVDDILYRLERDDCIDYILNGVLLPNVYRQLESYDISFSVANDFVDRLIDNDMYLNSPECSSDCECTDFCTCSRARREAKAILRKLIRHAVPGRRWRTSTERVADENVKDLLDDVFERVIPKGSIIETDKPMADVVQKFSYIDLTLPEREVYFSDVSEGEGSAKSDDYCKMSRLGEMPTMAPIDITKSLRDCEQLLLADTDQISADKFMMHMDQYQCPQLQQQPSHVHNIPSTHDISSVWDFAKTAIYCRTSSDEIPFEEEYSERSELNTNAEASDEIRERLESWTVEMSSSHLGFEEDAEEETEEEEFEERQEIEKTNVEQNKIDSQVRFDANPVLEQIIETEPLPNSDDSSGGVIPVSFSYDPTVKFTVPVASTYEMAMETETGETTAEYKGSEEKKDVEDNRNK